jgi:hypothetical protein
MIKYKEADFILEFERPVVFYNFPGDIIRRNVSSNLKERVCKNKDSNTCNGCKHKDSCAFGVLFSTKEIDLPGSGRSTAPSPLVITPESVGDDVDNVIMIRTVFAGEAAAAYFYDVYQAFVDFGKAGYGKNHYQFKVLDVFSQEKSLCNLGALTLEPEFASWEAGSVEDSIDGSFLVFFSTPYISPYGTLRGENLEYYRMIELIENRVKLIDFAYGDGSFEKQNIDKYDIEFSDYDLDVYQCDEKNCDCHKGLVGSFNVDGHFTTYEESLFYFATIFNIGKRAAEGYGRLYIDLDSEDGEDAGVF